MIDNRKCCLVHAPSACAAALLCAVLLGEVLLLREVLSFRPAAAAGNCLGFSPDTNGVLRPDLGKARSEGPESCVTVPSRPYGAAPDHLNIEDRPEPKAGPLRSKADISPPAASRSVDSSAAESPAAVNPAAESPPAKGPAADGVPADDRAADSRALDDEMRRLRDDNANLKQEAAQLRDEALSLRDETVRLRDETARLRDQLALRDAAVASSDGQVRVDEPGAKSDKASMPPSGQATAPPEKKTEAQFPSHAQDRPKNAVERAWKELVDLAARMKKDLSSNR